MSVPLHDKGFGIGFKFKFRVSAARFSEALRAFRALAAPTTFSGPLGLATQRGTTPAASVRLLS